MEIISCKEAKSKGLKRYFTGKTCKNGHSSERYSQDSSCLECKGVWLEDNKEKRNTATLNYRNSKKGNFKEHNKQYDILN